MGGKRGMGEDRGRESDALLLSALLPQQLGYRSLWCSANFKFHYREPPSPPLPSPPLPHPPPPPSLSALALKQAFLPHSPKPPCTPPLSMLKLRNWKPCRRDSSYGLIIHWAVPVCAKCMSVCVCMYTRVWVSHVLAVGWNRDFVMPYLWLS